MKATAALATREYLGSGESPSAPEPRLGKPTDKSRLVAFHDFRYPEASFRVALYDGETYCLPAASLVERAYSRLGYTCECATTAAFAPVRSGPVLQAAQDRTILGTLAVNLGVHGQLLAETLYADELATFRSRDAVCEFTRLALDTELAGREVLCSLFYTAYVYSHVVHAARHLFIEVNPRHARFYEHMLGFRQAGPEKHCPRVSAPAVLMHLDFNYTKEQIQRSRQGLSVPTTTLYRYAPPATEEALLIRRIEADVTA